MNEILSFIDTAAIEKLTQNMLKQATELGASQTEISIGMNKGFSISVRGGEAETIEYHQDKAIDIVVYMGKRSGSASLSDFQPASIQRAVEAACHIARFTDEDHAAGLAEPNELAYSYPTLDLAFPWQLSVEEAIQLACQCEQEALSYDKRLASAESVSITTMEIGHFYANSQQFFGYFPLTRHEMSCVLIGKTAEEMQRDYSYTIAADPNRLATISTIAKQAGERTIARLGAKTLPTMKVPVIFIAEEARSLIGHFAAAIQGGNLYRKSSFLLNQLHQPIFPHFVHIEEQPHLHHGLGSAPFDDDGVMTRPNIFVKEGVLNSYSLSVYSARKLGLQTTGNAGGIHNLLIKSTHASLSDLLKLMDKGLLITELMGNGVNLLTGNYSRGASGFWVEKGEIQYPVHEITIAGQLQDMYAKIQAIGNDIDNRGNIQTGSILIEEMMIAGH